MRHPAHSYRQFSVQGASPLGLVVMLYDGAIASMQRAITAMEANHISEKCSHLNRALAIIAQLEGTLNFERGGEVAQTLKRFYDYSRTQALKANLENSPEILRALVRHFASVREAWHQAEHGASPSTPAHSSEKTPRPPSPTPKSGTWQVSG